MRQSLLYHLKTVPSTFRIIVDVSINTGHYPSKAWKISTYLADFAIVLVTLEQVKRFPREFG